MFRYKTNKQAFIIAALVVLLCLVCLTGATLALFTNNGGDGTVGVIATAGDIEVDIVDSVNTDDSLISKHLLFQTTDSDGEVLFEPGATFHTQGFKIKNTGNIPINYRMCISDDADVDMEEFARAFEIWVSTDPMDRTKYDEITKFTGSLAVGEVSGETYYLIIKMKETAGNEFQNQTYEGIGITVFAVQGNVDIKEK